MRTVRARERSVRRVWERCEHVSDEEALWPSQGGLALCLECLPLVHSAEPSNDITREDGPA